MHNDMQVRVGVEEIVCLSWAIERLPINVEDCSHSVAEVEKRNDVLYTPRIIVLFVVFCLLKN